MSDYDGPVLDDHLHLDADNEGIEAVRAFARSGGTHLLVVNQPSWKLGVGAEFPGGLVDHEEVCPTRPGERPDGQIGRAHV